MAGMLFDCRSDEGLAEALRATSQPLHAPNMQMAGFLEVLPDIAGVLIGEYVALETIAVNAQSRALVARTAPLREPFWREVCMARGLSALIEHHVPRSKCLLFLNFLLEQLIIRRDWSNVIHLARNSSRTGLGSNYLVPVSMLRDVLSIDDNSNRLHVLRALLDLRTAPDAVHDLGEALVWHVAHFDPEVEAGKYIHIFRDITYHLERRNIMITALQYVQASYHTRRAETPFFGWDLPRVPVPPACADPVRFTTAMALMEQGQHQQLRTLLEQ